MGGHRLTHLDDLERVPLEHGVWRPIRRALGITGFGVNAYSAERAGDALIEPHDETSPGAGGHEELYVVVEGAATFTVDAERVDAPAGTLLLVEPETRREAVAAADDTTVLVVGGKPGAAIPPSPFEYWYAAIPAERRGDFGRAYAIAAEGLEHWPDHGTLHYALACYAAREGRADRALDHLRTAFANDPRTREWAREDSDLDSIRDDPAFPDLDPGVPR
jgi:mannose-6-phosphate isomerase-like protein (cupin superfamily)